MFNQLVTKEDLKLAASKILKSVSPERLHLEFTQLTVPSVYPDLTSFRFSDNSSLFFCLEFKSIHSEPGNHSYMSLQELTVFQRDSKHLHESYIAPPVNITDLTFYDISENTIVDKPNCFIDSIGGNTFYPFILTGFLITVIG